MRRPIAAIGSAVFFALAPGIVAGVVPWALTGWEVRQLYVAPVRIVGGLLIVAGATVLIHSFARFVVEGAGTPAPVAPTERLVVGGLYRYVRNPMYLAVVAAIVGQALVLGHSSLLRYALAVGALFVAFVLLYEEPALKSRFGAQYEAYRRAVPAWWPRRRAWHPEDKQSS